MGQLQTISGWDEVTLRRDEKSDDTMIHHELEDESCDDENNNAGCNWDGGACCGDNVSTDYCTECKCLDPNFGA